MPGKVILEVTKGALLGKKYQYESAERLFIGRQEDCGIVMPENTVSRYHCLLNIQPPSVKLQDFGSLNGTFLNGKKIGQRNRTRSWEEVKDEPHEEFILHSGDVLRLGRRCEIRCRIELSECSHIYEAEKSVGALAEKLNDHEQLLDGILDEMYGTDGRQGYFAPAFFEGYEKVALLGKGGMGQVWKVKERSSGKLYALKTMRPQAATDEKSKMLFLREAGIGECLKHENVVRVYQTGCADGTFYIVMDLCEGGSVDTLMEKSGGKLSVELATYIILQALSGLDYVHNADLEAEINADSARKSGKVSVKGAVHRDFKPGNILLMDQSNHPMVKVTDFGMAKAFETAGMSQITRSGQVMGTPVFMSRQQALDFKYAKPDADVWAVAATYYNMLTGCLPKNFCLGKNPWQVIVSESVVPIRQRSSSIPPSLAAVIDDALREQPEIGCRSAADFRENIINALPSDIYAFCKGVIE